MATSASCKVISRPWRTTLAPILISFSRKVVSDQCSTASGNRRDEISLGLGFNAFGDDRKTQILP